MDVIHQVDITMFPTPLVESVFVYTQSEHQTDVTVLQETDFYIEICIWLQLIFQRKLLSLSCRNKMNPRWCHYPYSVSINLVDSVDGPPNCTKLFLS